MGREFLPKEILGSEINYQSERITCPECERSGSLADRDMTHPIRVLINAGGQITTVTHKGTKVASGDSVGNGVLIAIEFRCEIGHSFTQRFHFSHGSTHSEKRHHKEFDGLPGFTTIWRD